MERTVAIGSIQGVDVIFDLTTYKFEATVDGETFQRGRWEDMKKSVREALSRFSLPAMLLPNSGSIYGLPRIRTIPVTNVKTSRGALEVYSGRNSTIDTTYVADDALIEQITALHEAHSAAEKELKQNYTKQIMDAIEAAKPRLVPLTQQLFNQKKREHRAQP